MPGEELEDFIKGLSSLDDLGGKEEPPEGERCPNCGKIHDELPEPFIKAMIEEAEKLESERGFEWAAKNAIGNLGRMVLQHELKLNLLKQTVEVLLETITRLNNENAKLTELVQKFVNNYGSEIS